MPAATKPSLDILIDQYLNYLLIEKGLSETTLQSYSSDMIRYREFLAENKIRRISSTDTAMSVQFLLRTNR